MMAFWPICIGHALVKKVIWSTIYKSSGFFFKKEERKRGKYGASQRRAKFLMIMTMSFWLWISFSFADENHK